MTWSDPVEKGLKRYEVSFCIAESMKTRIKELGEEYNIGIIEHSERGTSKTCCICGQQHNGRIHRGLYYCKENNIVINADVSGACKLYNVAVNGSLCPISKESSGSRRLAEPLMLRWGYHRWH